MKKTIGNPGQQINVDITKTTPLVCDNPECENDMFMPAMKFRKVPKLLTGTTSDRLVPVQVFFCSACGNIPKEFQLDV